MSIFFVALLIKEYVKCEFSKKYINMYLYFNNVFCLILSILAVLGMKYISGCSIFIKSIIKSIKLEEHK